MAAPKPSATRGLRQRVGPEVGARALVGPSGLPAVVRQVPVAVHEALVLFVDEVDLAAYWPRCLYLFCVFQRHISVYTVRHKAISNAGSVSGK